MTSLVQPPYHYIRNGDGEEELYQIEMDPSEASNLAHMDSLLAEYRTALDALWPEPSHWFAVPVDRVR
jgi:hypothetical protein